MSYKEENEHLSTIKLFGFIFLIVIGITIGVSLIIKIFCYLFPKYFQYIFWPLSTTIISYFTYIIYKMTTENGGNGILYVIVVVILMAQICTSIVFLYIC